MIALRRPLSRKNKKKIYDQPLGERGTGSERAVPRSPSPIAVWKCP
jgi:hypothetical protein